MNVGVLGGTFDPPHRGHLELGRIALVSGLVAEVWFVPCFRHRFQKEPTAFGHRLAMCELLIRNQPGMFTSDIETRINRPGHTLHLVRALQNDYPKKRFRLLFGADIYYQRHEWYKFDEIVKLAPPIYVAREGIDPIPEPTLSAPPGMSSTELREALRRGERPRDALPETVLDYIDKNRLYRSAL